jgi:hypothetical protein
MNMIRTKLLKGMAPLGAALLCLAIATPSWAQQKPNILVGS